MAYAIVGFESLAAAFEGKQEDIKAYALNQSQIRVLSAGEALLDVMSAQPPLTLDLAVNLSDTAATIQRVDPSYTWRFIQCSTVVTLTGVAR
jgi:hypothetical protein